MREASPAELVGTGLESSPRVLTENELFESSRARIRLLTYRMPVSFDYEFSLLVVDGIIRRAFLVSTARKDSVPILGVYRLSVPQLNSKPWPWKTSIKYDRSPMYWGLVIDGGYYFHSSPHYGNLGRPASKGCIRASLPDAMEVFDVLVNQMPGVPAYSLIFEKTDLGAADKGAVLLREALEASGWSPEDLKAALIQSRKEITAVSKGDLEYSPGVPVDSHARPFSGQFWQPEALPCCSDVNCWDYFKKRRRTLVLKPERFGG